MKITAPKGWSANKQTPLYTLTWEDIDNTPEKYLDKLEELAMQLGMGPDIVLLRDWKEIQFQVWCDEKAKEAYE